MIVDAHSHAWPRWPYTPVVRDLHTRGSAPSLLTEMETNHVDHAVLIAARIGRGQAQTCNYGNNIYLASMVAAHPHRFSMFADVDSFWSPEHHSAGAADRLEREIASTAASGFTHYLQGFDDGWMLSKEGDKFFSRAEDLQLIASLHTPPSHYHSISEVARRYPLLPIMLHHQGLAGTDDEVINLANLAARRNIYLKVSGFHYLTMEGYPFAEVLPRLQRLYKAFGADRLVWGSDYPVIKKYSVTYRETLDVVHKACRFVSNEEINSILGENMHSLLVSTGAKL